MTDFLNRIARRRPAAAAPFGQDRPVHEADLAVLEPAPDNAEAGGRAANGHGANVDGANSHGANGHAAERQAFEAKLLAHKLGVVAASGLFDQAHYLATYPDVAGADITPLEHFFSFGFREGRRPNPYFDPVWYMELYPEAMEQSGQPLLHFILHGEAHGRWPCPLFDPSWYRTRYGVPAGENTLAHYLRHRAQRPLSPIPEFDAEFYSRNNPDLAAAGIDLFEHFFNWGYKEGRNPSAEFDVRFYTQRYLRHLPDANPFLHFLEHRNRPGILGRLPDDEATVPREIRRFTSPGPEFEAFTPLPPGASRRFKLLAYHLPQFHPFAENDAWWGKGFTEWTNIARGVPRFAGHYQPRVPRDLGFYRLDADDALRRQVEMAQAAGVFGFVFYYYWFNGRRLMEKPVERFLADPSAQMPFALMWANENWTRRWDGSEQEVLISQDYRPEDDGELAANLAAHFRDPRYIRLQGRPLLMIYRPGVIPEAKAAIARWRALFRERHGEDPIMVTAQAFDALDPRAFGMDGAIEFPPHKLTSALPPANGRYEYLDPDFKGKIYPYDAIVDVSLADPAPPFPLIKTAVPSWDNDARRQGNGIVVTGSTPAQYEAWLARLGDIAESRPFFGEPLVCVNAWNEWCEGAYLEPDLHFGAAYLNATARAVTGRTARGAAAPVLLIGHDAFPSGAQHLLLHIGRTLRRAFGVRCEFLLLGDGALLAEYEREAPVTVAASDEQLGARVQEARQRGVAAALVNTAAAARAIAYCHAHGIDSTLLIHELPRIVREKHLADAARHGLRHAAHSVYAAPFVRDALLGDLGLGGEDEAGRAARERALILPQGSYNDVTWQPEAARALRDALGLDAARDRLVIGVAYADLRKGYDLFLQLWRRLRDRADGGRVHCAWVGGMDPTLQEWLGPEIADAEASGTFHMLGYRRDLPAIYSAADAFVLTSREDPFPTVVLEAMGAGTPVFAFDRAGGIPDMLRATGAGTVVPYCDVGAMADAVGGSLAAPVSAEARRARHETVRAGFDFTAYAGRLLRLLLPDAPAVSVAVPNYNYARYMPARLGTIFRQSRPVHEVIVLDDCSTDGSPAVIAQVAEAADRVIRFVPNAANSGSVFAQWRKAAELATGELVWIAEADDESEPGFLAGVSALLARDPAMVMAFADSRTIGAEGEALDASYKPYYATVRPDALTRTEAFDGADFIGRFLAVKNLILNVSAVVWRRDALLRALDACQDDLRGYRMAGDWRLYLAALSAPGARIGYEASPLNVHRRHAQSVTHALDADRHVAEIARCQALARETGLSAATAQAQRDYLAEVAAQLGAARPAAPPRRPAAKRVQRTTRKT